MKINEFTLYKINCELRACQNSKIVHFYFGDVIMILRLVDSGCDSSGPFSFLNALTKFGLCDVLIRNNNVSAVKLWQP